MMSDQLSCRYSSMVEPLFCKQQVIGSTPFDGSDVRGGTGRRCPKARYFYGKGREIRFHKSGDVKGPRSNRGGTS